MRVTVLGSGTSHGVPTIGCSCPVCRSCNPRNRRFRTSIAVQGPSGTILVDTPPELRLAALAFDLARVDAVLYTHSHADHLFGLDDVRRYNDLSGQELPIYADERTLDDIRRAFRYVFHKTQVGGGKPRLTLNPVPPQFTLCGIDVRTFTVLHGKLPVQAYRFDDLAYVTDVNRIPEPAMDQLRGLDVLILDAVRYKPHSTHFGLFQALEVIAELRPKRAFLTHLSHQFDHDAVNAILPAGVLLAYDGLRIDL
jgi:phosphoribosyl 1,2-cyclic phosphate phosphodiesterase